MTNPPDTDQTATVVISHHVKDDAKNNYESWLKEIIPVSKGYWALRGWYSTSSTWSNRNLYRDYTI
jgi:antibiotic biosynthesis monooxygenase (ABM) superfamily enzyme